MWRVTLGTGGQKKASVREERALIVVEAKVLHGRNCQGVSEREGDWLECVLNCWREFHCFWAFYVEIACYEMEQIRSTVCNDALGDLGRWHCVVWLP
jgi:hypothetical protein